MASTENKALIERFWTALYDRDFEAVAAFFTEDGCYTDIGTPPEDVAIGAEQIIARLTLGIEPIAEYTHVPKLMVGEGDVVITEHEETWGWHSGESVTLPFVSVHVLEGGKIARWTDYWDLQTLLGAAPAWWIEHIMEGSA